MLAAIVFISSQAQAHPCDGWVPNDLPSGYGTDYYPFPSDFSYGEITFSSPYADPASLTDAERYIVAGAMDGNKHVAPWHEVIYQVVNAIYSKLGYVPSVLTEEDMRSVFSTSGDIDPDVFKYYTSPITNQLPRLDASSFAPGQVFIRPMTQDEIDHIADLVPIYHQNLIDHVWINPETNARESIAVRGPVFYIRIYGENSVIYEGIKYSYHPAK